MTVIQNSEHINTSKQTNCCHSKKISLLHQRKFASVAELSEGFHHRNLRALHPNSHILSAEKFEVVLKIQVSPPTTVTSVCKFGSVLLLLGLGFTAPSKFQSSLSENPPIGCQKKCCKIMV